MSDNVKETVTERFDNFVTGITSINRSLQRIKKIKMAGFNLKGIHVMCLFKLYHNPEGMTLTGLASQCCEDKAAISRTVSDLTKKGLVMADSAAKYRAPLILTPEGRKIAISIDEMIYNAVPAGGDGLTDEERAVFYKALSHISDNLETYLNNQAGGNYEST